MDLPTLLLGVIAVSTLVMAAVQIGLIIYGARLARRVDRLIDQIENEIQPALKRVNTISSDAERAASLAVAQVERADQLFAQFAQRLDHLMDVAQEAVVEPLRQGVALLQGFRSAIAALRGSGEPAPKTGEEPLAEEDDEALFIG
jgi:hypothetical protein